MNNLKPIEWKDIKSSQKVITDFLKEFSQDLKEEVWFKYSVCFKKDKNGNLNIRNPEAKEL